MNQFLLYFIFTIFQAILSSDKNVNIIIVNWDSYNQFDLNYTRNLTVPLLGNIVAKFVKQLIAFGSDPKKMYFIGFSAGCEILGLAAKQITPKINRFLGTKHKICGTVPLGQFGAL